jgi:regulatory protein
VTWQAGRGRRGFPGAADAGAPADPGSAGRGRAGSWGSAAAAEVPTEERARGLVLDSLAGAARTRGQLEAMLERKGVDPELGAQVLDRFEEVGLIDDAGYAQAFVESRHEVRGQGRRALAYELRRRGVDDEAIAGALDAVDDEREFATACRLAGNRARRLQGLPPEVRVRRLAGFLARKGYSGDTVSRAVRQAVAEADAAMVAEEPAEPWGDGDEDEL